MTTEWSIQDIARLTGTTSRALRHYGDKGLLRPSRTGHNGQRYYDQAGLVRLQRILLLRELGLGLPVIRAVLDRQHDTAAALREHLEVLELERERLGRQAAALRTTIRKLEEGAPLMAEEILDGFDHTQYEQEVTQRWGKEAYESGDRWWKSLSGRQKAGFKQEIRDLAGEFAQARENGEPADGDRAQRLARRQAEWLGRATEVSKEYLVGLGEMYVQDPRFGRNFAPDGEDPTPYAEYVRDALRVYAERNL